MRKLKPLIWNVRVTNEVTVYSTSSPTHSYDIRFDEEEGMFKINIHSYRTGKSTTKFKKTLDEAKQWCQEEHYELKVKKMFED